MDMIQANNHCRLYKNPIARHGDFADPFIMKYNGRYYLYCTNPGVKCWSSMNLVEWKYEGAVADVEEFRGMVPFAPEVVYWNGKFYMYTSPSGLGHYILQSDSPTGPFKLQTKNIGHSIDGSVFIDDDGKWYFYHASDIGIKAHTMKDPLTIGDEILTEAFMDGWTEGPGVIKRNGKYYMTYTGNHYLSAGYRVNYAVSEKSPVSGFVPYNKNPLLINTEGEGVGLGHSMSFIGPDLDTWYIAYHNLNSDASRDLNIDRLAWNGDKMVVLGPTVSQQPAPEMPEFYDYFENSESSGQWVEKSGRWHADKGFMKIREAGRDRSLIVAKHLSKENYTAEFNMKLSGRPVSGDNRFGAVISYKGGGNYGMILLDPDNKNVETRFIVDGIAGKTEVSELPQEYDFSVLHCVRIEKAGNKVKVFVDGMHKQTRIIEGLTGGSIGFVSYGADAAFGYTAVSGKVNGEGVFNAYKPVPGSIEAVHFNRGGENAGYIELCTEGGCNTALRVKGEWLAYNINVEETADYNVDIRVSDVKHGAQVRIRVDDVVVLEPEDLNMEYLQEWRTVTLKGLKLPKGLHTLRIELINGGFRFYKMDFYKARKEPPDFRDSFDTGLGNWSYVTGLGQEFVCEDGMLQLGPYGKIAAGEDGWSDYSVEVDLKAGSDINSGVVFRVTNPAEGGEGWDRMLGTNFYQGYFAGLTSKGVVLAKQNYNWKELSSAEVRYDPGRLYHLKVEAKGDNINVFVDDMNKAVINYTDKDPFTHGKAGIRTEGAIAFFGNFTVKAI
ncbi:MAG: family 43 glycosylhydrolase [Bacillota bacterium]